MAYLKPPPKRPRTADRHKLRGDRHRTPRTHFMDKPLAAIDSEAMTEHCAACVAAGGQCTIGCQHRLVMVTCAREDGEHWTLHGTDLGTEQIFTWLFSLPLTSHNLVWYAGMYDADMWCKDVWPKRTLRRLADEKPTRWHSWRITNVRHHSTAITRFDGPKKVGTRLVWDVIGFFQQSFVKTLKDWKVGTDEEVAFIERLKQQRSTFAEAERAEIAAYNTRECALLVAVVRRLLSLCAANDIQLTRLDGAGAAAAAMLRKYHVDQYLQNPAEIEDVARWALYGGRIDITKAGLFGDVHQYDINSAYPSACVDMPCWTCGAWSHAMVDTAPPHRPLPLGIYRISWEWYTLRAACPLPFRRTDGGIRYPATGSGHYWSMELNELSEADWQHVKVYEAWTFTRGCEHQPFSFVPEIYAARRILKAAGDLGHLVLKLPINAVYGKLAQGTSGYNKKPRYQSFVAAGYVTSWCRARVIRALGNTVPLSIATDGVVTEEPLDVDEGTGLGQWEHKQHHLTFIVQPGVYMLSGKGYCEEKTRGANPAALNFDLLLKHWRGVVREGLKGEQLFEELKYTYCETRFYGLKVALTRKDFPWRHWLSSERTIGPGSARHISHGSVKDHYCSIAYYSPFNAEADCEPGVPTSLWRKLAPGTNQMSQRYEPKREATWTENELLHHYHPDPSVSSYHLFDR